MEEYVWRKGTEKCERSYITDKPQPVDSSATMDSIENKIPSTVASNAEIPLSGIHREISNKREISSLKLSERHLMGQTTYNPFMVTNNYVKDIDVQMSFLMPQKG